MYASKIYEFYGCAFDTVVAHKGDGLVKTKRMVSASSSATCNFIDLTIVPAKSSIGIHTHTTDNEEIYVIVRGKGLMILDSKQQVVSAGCVIVNRPGGCHGLTNLDDSDLELVVIEIPVKEAH